MKRIHKVHKEANTFSRHVTSREIRIISKVTINETTSKIGCMVLRENTGGALPVMWSKNNVAFLRIKISENLLGRDQTKKKPHSCLAFFTTFVKALDHGPSVLR